MQKMRDRIKYRLFIGWTLLAALTAMACHKDGEAIAEGNHFPVARAGDDLSISITCSSRFAELDGKGSYDPDADDKIQYSWAKISGPSCVLINSTSQVAYVTNLASGQYTFQLQVTDASGLTSRDTVGVSATGSTTPSEMDMDATFTCNFRVSKEPWFCFDLGPVWGYHCTYADITRVEGSFNQSTFGEMYFSANENAMTDTSGYHDTQIGVGCKNCAPSQYISGTSSINFKELIRHGGGAFDGTWIIDSGSATTCDQGIFTNLVPLNVSGIMDTTMHTIVLTIKGKAYF